MTQVTWNTWSGTHTARPRELRTPTSTADVVAAVHAARADDLTVRMVGSGHSFTEIAITDGMLLAPTALGRVRSVDAEAGRATVEAGMPLRDLNTALAAVGVAMPNLGDIDRQTVAGAVQTGTHGTGRITGGLATQVRGMELVLADGEVVTCSPDHDTELFEAARVGLGAFGVLTAMTLNVVPSFLLNAVEAPMPLEEVLARLPELRADNDHFEFYWFPHTRRTLTKQNNRTTGPAAPLSPLRAWLDDDFLSNTVFEGVSRFARAVPAAVPMLNQVSARGLSARSYTDTSYRVFTSERRVRFIETEYAVPAERTVEVITEIAAMIRRRDHRIGFPLEIRFAPADDVWLSTAYGRDTAYIAAHVYRGEDYRSYFADLEAIFTRVGGRPHWGKMHTRDRAYLEEVYPRLGDALEVRDRVDPQRRFGNAYLQRVLGD